MGRGKGPIEAEKSIHGATCTSRMASFVVFGTKKALPPHSVALLNAAEGDLKQLMMAIFCSSFEILKTTTHRY